MINICFKCIYVSLRRVDTFLNSDQKRISSSSIFQFYCFGTGAVWVKRCYNNNQAHESYSVHLLPASE